MDDIPNQRFYHCNKKYTNSLDVLDHCFNEHPDKELGLLNPIFSTNENKFRYKSIHYGKKTNTKIQNEKEESLNRKLSKL